MAVSDEMWVGRILDTGAIIVYDASLQIPEVANIHVYSLNRGLVRQFDPVELRAKVETVHGSDHDSALVKYKSWKDQHGDEFMRREPLRLVEEARRVAAEEERIREAHRLRLIQLGIDPKEAEARNVDPRRHRVTHCYACKRGLDSKIFLACAACNWIICVCGACGCGYASQASSR